MTRAMCGVRYGYVPAASFAGTLRGAMCTYTRTRSSVRGPRAALTATENLPLGSSSSSTDRQRSTKARAWDISKNLKFSHTTPGRRQPASCCQLGQLHAISGRILMYNPGRSQNLVEFERQGTKGSCSRCSIGVGRFDGLVHQRERVNLLHVWETRLPPLWCKRSIPPGFWVQPRPD